MRLILELSKQEELKLMRYITKTSSEVAGAAIRNYFKYIKRDEFVKILRRALKLSSDAYFQQFMQYYIDQKAPHLFKKIHRDLLKQIEREAKSLKR